MAMPCPELTETRFRQWMEPDDFLFVIHDVFGGHGSKFAADCVSYQPRSFFGIRGGVFHGQRVVMSAIWAKDTGCVEHIFGLNNYFLDCSIWLKEALREPVVAPSAPSPR